MTVRFSNTVIIEVRLTESKTGRNQVSINQVFLIIPCRLNPSGAKPTKDFRLAILDGSKNVKSKILGTSASTQPTFLEHFDLGARVLCKKPGFSVRYFFGIYLFLIDSTIL